MAETILVVDDEPGIRRMMEYQLQVEGYRVLTASNGAEALQRIAGSLPDLVILDMMMPDMDGNQVSRVLRGQPRTAGLPILMLSARSQLKDRVAGLEAGADDYVSKPAELPELIARVKALLSRSRRGAPAEPVKRGRVLAVMGAKGGVGATTVCLNTAVLLARQPKSVILIELRPAFGTLSVLLKATPASNLADLVGLAPDQVTDKELRSRLIGMGSGIKVLFGPQSAADSRELAADWAEALVRQASAMADYVLLDLPPMPTAAVSGAIGLAELVLLVMEPEPACVKAAQVTLDLLVSWRVSKSTMGVVVSNRSAVTNPVPLREIRTAVGCEILGVVPPAMEACLGAQAQGMPLVLYKPDSMVAVALSDMMTRLIAPNMVGIRV